MKHISQSFARGMLFMLGVYGFLQDWMGLDGYIAYVTRNWTELHWSVMATVAVYFMIDEVLSMRRLRQGPGSINMR